MLLVHLVDTLDGTVPAVGDTLIRKFLRNRDTRLQERIICHLKIRVCQVNNQIGDLQVSVNQIVYIKLLIIVSKWIENCLSNLNQKYVDVGGASQ